MTQQEEFEFDGNPLADGPVLARFFGGFSVTVDGRPVPWVRRMDKRIFRYLLLAPDGRVTRKALIDTFWPGQDETAAHGSLRTACSNVRKAVGMAAGAKRVEECFSTTGDAVLVNLDVTSVDVRRYLAHIAAGNTCHLTTDVREALVHYKRALTIYSGPIGWGDEPEPWLESLGQQCDALRTLALERIVAMCREDGDTAQAMKYGVLLADKYPRGVAPSGGMA
jgi:DNA-binding SARP family transcriptional activator